MLAKVANMNKLQSCTRQKWQKWQEQKSQKWQNVASGQNKNNLPRYLSASLRWKCFFSVLPCVTFPKLHVLGQRTTSRFLTTPNQTAQSSRGASEGQGRFPTDIATMSLLHFEQHIIHLKRRAIANCLATSFAEIIHATQNIRKPDKKKGTHTRPYVSLYFLVPCIVSRASASFSTTS